MDDPCAEFRPVVLIAPHNKNDLELLKDASLKYNKFDLVTASTGQEIVDKINENCFDAVIIGLKFPDLTGSTLAFLIHEFDALIRIGFLTIYNTQTLVESAEQLNCVFLDKNKEMKNLDTLCEKIYGLATEIPCADKLRISERKSSEADRNRYKEYNKLSIPPIMKVQGILEYGN